MKHLSLNVLFYRHFSAFIQILDSLERKLQICAKVQVQSEIKLNVVSVFCLFIVHAKYMNLYFFYNMNVAVYEILEVNKGKYNRTRQKCINVFIKVLIVMCWLILTFML